MCGWVIRLIWIVTVVSAQWNTDVWNEDNSGICTDEDGITQTDFYHVNKKPLKELHIRHNLKGHIELRDGEARDKDIRIAVTRRASAQSMLDQMRIETNIYDVGGTHIYMLQVDYKEKKTSFLVIVGGGVAVIVLLVLICIVIWLYHRKHGTTLQQPSAVARSASSSPRRVHSPGPSARRMGDDHRSVSSQGNHKDNGNSLGGDKGTEPAIPPPPRLFTANHDTTAYNTVHRNLGTDKTDHRPTNNGGTGVAGGGGGGGYRGTFVTFSILSLVSLAYAACYLQTQINIVVYIPARYNPDVVMVFLNHRDHNQVSTNRWFSQNATQVNIFDLENAAITKKTPCSTTKKCPRDLRNVLVSCDAGRQECVCERGYQLIDGRCKDINECVVSAHLCSGSATCQNIEGSYICYCGTGYYYDLKTNRCTLCSHRCPSGQYEATPCTYTADRTCAACSACTGSTYEIRPCTEASQDHCVHAAHPVLLSEDETEATYLEGLKAESSSNAFIENLHNTRDLTTTYYVTDNKQATDFFWFRESGIRVNIGITNVNIIPEYVDVDYESDNNYMMRNPNTIDEKTKLKKITQDFCRNPIPDHYTLTLEVSRDRTTSAKSIVCNSMSPSSSCPEGYEDGDIYIDRTLNEACTKMNYKGTFPEVMQPAANSVVCTRDTALLTEIFNKTASPVRPIRFMSKRCKNAKARCDQCINQEQCQLLEVFNQLCCRIDCYSLPDCKMAQSDKCMESPVECAMGDAYRYTIQPVYQHLKEDEFSCHIRHRKPEIVYKLWFYVSVVGTEFETPKIYKTITRDDLGNLSQGFFDMNFFSVEHNVGIQLSDDFILKGRNIYDSSSSRRNYTVYPMKKKDEYDHGKIASHDVDSRRIFVAKIQFDTPFGYSTSTWTNGNQCDKETKRFKSSQSHYHDNKGQSLNPVIQAVGAPYEYTLKSYESPPYMRFIIPSNISVLDWWFKERGPYLIQDDSLQAKLELTDDMKIWTIYVKGELDSCPGYVSVRINDRMELEELFHYDVLVSCPSNFSLEFKVPNWGMKQDKTFDILLSDAKKEFRLFLTHLTITNLTDMPVTPSTGAQIHGEFNDEHFHTGYGFLITVGVIIAVILLLYVVSYAYMENTQLQSMEINQLKYSEKNQAPKLTCCHSGRTLTSGQFLFVAVYILFKIFYSLLFTFTIFFTVLMFLLQNDVASLNQVARFQVQQYNRSENISKSIEEHTQKEIVRQANQVLRMHGACGNYMQELSDIVAGQFEDIATKQFSGEQPMSNVTISHVVQARYDEIARRYRESLENFTRDYERNVNAEVAPIMKKFDRYAQSIFANQWLTFPNSLYNSSKNFNIDLGVPVPDASVDTEFLWFLELEQSMLPYLFTSNFWESYSIQVPLPSEFPLPSSLSSPQLCNMSSPINNSASAPLYHQKNLQLMDTSRHFVTSLPVDTAQWPWEIGESEMKSVEDISRRAKDISVTTKKNSKNNEEEDEEFSYPREILDGSEFIESLQLDVLRVIFIVIDVILLLYRFSHLYVVSQTLCNGFDTSCVITEEDIKTTTSKLFQFSDQQQLIPLQTTAVTMDSTNTNVEVYANHTLGSMHQSEDVSLLQQDTTLTKPRKPQNGNAVPVQEPFLPQDSEDSCMNTVNTNSRGSGCNSGGSNSCNTGTAPISIPIISKPGKSTCSKLSHVCYIFTDKLISTDIVPKCLLCLLLVFLLYLLVVLSYVVLCTETFAEYGAFDGFVAKVTAHLDATNWYLGVLSDGYTDTIKEAYEKYMGAEFKELQGLVDFFNTEQKRLARNHELEVCSLINGSSFPSSFSFPHSCNSSNMSSSSSTPAIDIPILPCNFVPVQPKYFSAYSQWSFLHQLSEDFTPLISSARSCVVSFSYAVLLVAATILLFHLIGSLIFHYLRTRHVFPVHHTYIVPAEAMHVLGGDVASGAGNVGVLMGGGDGSLPSNSSLLNSKSRRAAKYGLHVQFSTAKPQTLLTDLGYSETKV